MQASQGPKRRRARKKSKRRPRYEEEEQVDEDGFYEEGSAEFEDLDKLRNAVSNLNDKLDFVN